MNAFVRDGAVNRKRRARPTTRYTEPQRKKTCKMNVREATSVPRDLVASTSQTHSGECSDNQLTTIVPTEKESRYSNIEFIRARAFVYFDFKKNSSLNVNNLLKQHLKEFDENESHLKRIFEQCYDLTGSVEISKAMMKQLSTCPRVDVTSNSSSRVSKRLSRPRNVVKKTVKIVKNMEDKKIMTTQLQEIIDNKNLILFGKEYSTKDKGVLYSDKINDNNTTPKIDYYSDTTVTSDDEIHSSIRITKAYSVNNKKKKSSEITQVNKPNTDGIVQGHSNLRINNFQSNQVSAKKKISSTNQKKISAYKRLKKNPVVHDTANSQISSTNMNDVEEKINPRLKTDASVQNAEDFASETVNDVVQILVPQFKIDVIVKNSEGSALEKNIDYGEITIPREEIVECGPNAKDSALEANIDIEEIAYPRLIIDECVQNNDESSALETNFDVRENVTLREIDECGPNAKDPALETNIDVEEIEYPRLVIDECVQNDESSASETNFDVGENVPLVEKDECVKNSNDNIKIEEMHKCTSSSALKTNISTEDVNQIVDLELEQNTRTSDVVNSQINELEIDITDSETQSEILDHENLELKIRKIINTNDKIFANSTIKDLATYFLNDDFLYKIDALWTTTESELVGELIINLLNMFNDTQYNMARLTGCLICIFREIAQRSSILSSEMKLKLFVFLDAVKKYIKIYDIELWKNWFLPSMFFDWCFIVACIFMNTKNEFKIYINKSVIKNAETYYKKVKQCRYLFIQDSKPTKSHKKTGIFELTRIDDLLEIDGVHATNDTNITSDVSVVHSNDLETDDNSMDHTTPGSIVAEEVCPVPVRPTISVCPEFSFSNSFVIKSTWINGNVSELLNIMNVPMSERNIKSSTDQNDTAVGNNIEPSTNKRLSANKNAIKSKKSKTQSEPRVYFTVPNDSRQYEINYQNSNLSSTSQMSVPKKSRSSVPKKSRSSVTKKSSSSEVHQLSNLSAPQMNSSSISRSSPVVPHMLSSAVAPQNLSPYYNNYSSVSTNSHLPVGLQTVASRNYSLYYNNLSSNYTHVPIGLQTRPSISYTTTQTSNTGGTNSTVEKSATSTQHQFYSHQQNSMHSQHSIATNSQLQKAANTWPPNLYQNLFSDPSGSKSSIYHTQNSNSAMSYSQSQYNQNIQSVTSHPQHSNALTYPTNYTQPIPSEPLARIAEQVASMNTHLPQQNYNYGNSYLSQNHLQTPDHDTQVSPDLPDARLPNMPNHQDSNTIIKTCMAANCSNTSSFPCNTCMAAFYCSTQCQKSDWHYHQNECHLSF